MFQDMLYLLLGNPVLWEIEALEEEVVEEKSACPIS